MDITTFDAPSHQPPGKPPPSSPASASSAASSSSSTAPSSTLTGLLIMLPSGPVTPSRRMSKLINRASRAAPPAQDGPRSKYAHLVPVVSTLLSGGFSMSDAIAWLIHEHEIPLNRKESAYRSLRQLLVRRGSGSSSSTRTDRRRNGDAEETPNKLSGGGAVIPLP